MVLAFYVHATGLRPLISVCFSKMDTGTGMQAVEIRIDDTVSVKIDFPPIMGLDPAMVLFRYEPANLAMGFGCVLFHIAVVATIVVLQLPGGRRGPA